MERDYLSEWGVSPDDVNRILRENPPVYSTLSGFVTEYQLRRMWLERAEITNLERPTASNRKAKGDFWFDYRGRRFTLEVKSLDGPKVRSLGNDQWSGTFQCNASDSREVVLPSGSKVKTNCLVTGEFDVLAVGLFAFGNKWRFAFAKNDDLPRSTWRNYTPEQQAHLLKSSMKIAWPLPPPYNESLLPVLDSILG